MKKKIKWIILLVIGILPFAIGLLMGVYAAYTGFAPENEAVKYGLAAFGSWLKVYSSFFWPIYISGSMLIIIAVYKMIKMKKEPEY